MCQSTMHVPEWPVKNVVWTYVTFRNDSGIEPKFKINLEEKCSLGVDQHLSYKYFLKIALVIRIRDRYRYSIQYTKYPFGMGKILY